MRFPSLKKPMRTCMGKVAFGVLAQMVLENRPYEQIRTILDFCKNAGLPACLKQIGILENISEKLPIVAQKAMAKGETVYSMHVPVDKNRLYNAMLVADGLNAA